LSPAGPIAAEASLSVRPTAAGSAVIAIAVGSLPIGLLGLDLAFALGSLLLAAAVASPWSARRAARALEVTAAPSALRPIAGRATPLTVRLTALGGRSWSTAVAVLDVDGGARDATAAARVSIPRLAAGESIDAVALARFHARGRRDAVAIELSLAAPFALFDVRRVVVAPCRVVVGARPSSALDPALSRWTRSRAAAELSDRLRTSRRGALRDLPDGLRPARAGTPARELAWAATLRTGRPVAFAREADPAPREIDVVLVLDARGRPRAADAAFEAAVRVSARTLHALRRGGAAPRLALSPRPARDDPAAHAASSAVVATTPRAAFDALATVRRTAPSADGAAAREAPRAIVVVAASAHEVRGARLAAHPGRPRAHARAGDVVLALVASDLECAVVQASPGRARDRRTAREEAPA